MEQSKAKNGAGISLFDGINEQELIKINHCFKPKTSQYSEKETIMTFSDKFEKIAVLISGRAHLYFIDSSGEVGTIEIYTPGDVFGELFFLPVEGLEYIVEADTECCVMFIDYNHMTHTCQNACQHHAMMLDNLFKISADKAKKLTLRLNILARRSTRKKILSYFEYLASVQGERSVKIPMKMATLAEYLCIDRCSMARELRKMREEKLIETNGRKITLLICES